MSTQDACPESAYAAICVSRFRLSVSVGREGIDEGERTSVGSAVCSWYSSHIPLSKKPKPSSVSVIVDITKFPYIHGKGERERERERERGRGRERERERK